MQSDEQIYELVAKELATSPRQGLLIKCMAKCEGSESKGKAMYIETRVDEIKREIKQKAKEEAKDAAKNKEPDDAVSWFVATLIALFILSIFGFTIYNSN